MTTIMRLRLQSVPLEKEFSPIAIQMNSNAVQPMAFAREIAAAKHAQITTSASIPRIAISISAIPQVTNIIRIVANAT